MVRPPASARYFAGLLLVAAGCGAARPQPTLVRAEPLPVSENQQGHVEPIEPALALGPSEETPPMPEQPSIAGVYLWCQDPQGRACALATAALGTGPKDVSGLPADLLRVEDMTDDCHEPTIATVSGRLAAAFAVQSSGWRDQGGAWLDPSLLSDMYQAAGCINDADPALPIAKISAGADASPRVYLVRVWDGQTPTY